jgi:hypothetical protein
VRPLVPVLVLAASAVPAAFAGDTLVLELTAVADNTLYETPAGDISNGAGQHVFAGVNFGNQKRRGLVRFDVADAIPFGSVIESVELTLNCSRAADGGGFPLSLHRVLASWGESTSNAPLEEGQGAPAANGDATWLHRFFPGDPWANPGGDFAPAASATISVGGTGLYTWGSTDDMEDDVALWLTQPELNHGWLIHGDESTVGTTKRCDTRENGDPSIVPRLAVEFTPPPTAVTPETWARVKTRHR